MAFAIAVFMLTCNIPFAAFAAEDDGITISSQVTAQDIEIDEDVAFTYYIEIDNQPYEGIATGSDSVIYRITDGILKMPYNVKATITDIPSGAKYSIKRLEYDNDKYALIKETEPEVGDMTSMEYYVTVDGGEQKKIDAKTYNEATDNGKNTTVKYYSDEKNAEYDASRVSSISAYEVVRNEGLSTTYTMSQKDFTYITDSYKDYEMTFTVINSGYSTTGNSFTGQHQYSGTVSVGISGFDLDESVQTTETSNGTSPRLGGKKENAAKSFITTAGNNIGRLSYRIFEEQIKPKTGKIAVLTEDPTAQLPDSSQLSDSGEQSFVCKATACSFTPVTEHTAVYETQEVSAEKDIVFGDTVFAPAPTGTFSVDYIIYSGTYPESYEGAAFEIRDINGNILVEGEDYQLQISSDSVNVMLADIGYTQYIFSGLKHGFYTIQQIKGADGFIMDSTVYPFEVQREDGAVIGEHFDKSDFKSQYTALTNNNYSFVKSFKVFKNNSFSIKFTKVDQNKEIVKGAQFLFIERDALLDLVLTLARSGIDSVGSINIQDIISQLQSADWSNLDIGTILGLILNIVNLDSETLSKITIPAILMATSDENGIVSISNSSNILNVVGALANSGVSGEQLAEALKSVFGSTIPEEYLPLLDTLAGLTGTIKVNTNMRSGAYVMIETQAPEGYERNSLVYTFIVNADGTANVSAGVLFPVIVDALNSRFGIDLKELLVSPEEFDRYKDSIGGAFETFDEYASAVIDNVVNFLSGILGEDNSTSQTLTDIKDRIHSYYEQYGDLADSIGQTIKDINSSITDQVTEDWLYYDTRYFLDVAINITDCNGNQIDGATFNVLDANGNEMGINEDGKTVTLPFGDYKIENVAVPVGYLLMEDSVVSEITINDASGEYAFNYSYHKQGDPVVMTEDSSCETDGTKTTIVYCELCGETLSEESETIPAKGHSFGPWETVTSSTCTSKGYEERTCSTCGKKETKDLELSEHEWQDTFTVDKEATCTEDGSKSIHCKNCDSVRESTSIPAKGHTVEIDDAKAPTCTETGLTEGRHCSVCHDVLVEQMEIPAKGHDWNENYTVDKEPTCTEKGQKSIYCKNCDAVKESAEIPAKGHTFGDWKTEKAPTCTDKGSEKRTCSECGYSETKDLDAKGHSLGPWETEKAPTCTDKGSQRRSCSECDYFETKSVDETGHDWASDYTIDKAPTCTEKGQKSIYCKKCDAVKETVEIPAKGHKLGDWETEKAPTCTDKGSEKRTCSECDYFETRDLDAKGHSLGPWETEKAPTCTDKGSEKRTCSECDYFETRELDETGHDWASDYTIDKEPTCTEEGSKAIHCKNCDAVKESVVIPAIGHSFGEWNTVKEATETETGTMERICSVCGYIETEEIPVLEATSPKRPKLTVNGHADKDKNISYDSYADDDYNVTFTYEGKGELTGWDIAFNDADLILNEDYTAVESENGELIVEFISDEAKALWDEGNVVVNANVKYETTTTAKNTQKKDNSKKSPATGNARYTAGVAGMLICTAVGLVIVSSKKREEDNQ